tara:strand:- start:3687 stop:3827 length:141 start_codon:yes stop_codon:yes gene_type:complete
MHEILHIIGLCPESFAYQNILNIFILNYQETLNIINKSYETIKNIF